MRFVNAGWLLGAFLLSPLLAGDVQLLKEGVVYLIENQEEHAKKIEVLEQKIKEQERMIKTLEAMVLRQREEGSRKSGTPFADIVNHEKSGAKK